MLHLRSLNKKQRILYQITKATEKAMQSRRSKRKYRFKEDSDGQQENTTTSTRARRLHAGFDGCFQRT
jgi:hypothetical protein